MAALGVLVRVRAFISGRSLWVDEVLLALNFRDRSIADILSAPLLYDQSAPPGFIIGTYILIRVFGESVFSLRAVPFLSGVATVFLSVFLALKLIKTWPGQIAFVGLVSFSPVLVYYTNELKQYSVDVFAIVALMSLWLVRQKRFGWLGLIGGGFLLGLVSFPAVLFMGSLLILFLFQIGKKYLQKELNLTEVKKFSVLTAFWLGSTVIHGWYVLTTRSSGTFLVDWWLEKRGFPPEDVLGRLTWHGQKFTELSWISVAELSRVGPGIAVGNLWVPLLILAVFIAGLARHDYLFPIIFVPVMLGLALANLMIYPFSTRLSLWVIPLIFLGVGLGLDRLVGLPGGWILSPLVLVSILVTPINGSIKVFLEPVNDHNMSWVVEELSEKARFGDLLVLDGYDLLIANWHGVDRTLVFQEAVNMRSLGEQGNFWALGVRGGGTERIWIASTFSINGAKRASEALQFAGYVTQCVFDENETYLELLATESSGDQGLCAGTK